MPRRRPPAHAEQPPQVEEAIRAAVVFSRQEVNAQLSFVEDLIVQGASASQIVRLTVSKYFVTATRAKKLIERVKELHATEDAEARAEWKSAQIRRLQTMRRLASGERTADGKGWIVKPDHKAVVAYERLLAQICGTLEPVQIDVDVRHTEAIRAVIVNMTPEQSADLLAEAEEQERLANAARRLLPSGVIDVVADSTESVQAAE